MTDKIKMKFYKIYLVCFVSYAVLIISIGCAVILIGFSMGFHADVPDILMTITKIVLYPIGLVDSLMPFFLSKRISFVIAIGVADSIVSLLCAAGIAGAINLIKRF